MSSRILKRKREASSTGLASKIRRSSFDALSNPIVEAEWRPAREDMFKRPLDERTLRSTESSRSPIATRRRTTMFASSRGTTSSIPSTRFYGGQAAQLSEPVASKSAPPNDNNKTKLGAASSKETDGSGEQQIPGRRRQSPGTARSKLTRLRRPAERPAAPQQQNHQPQQRSASSTKVADPDAGRPAAAPARQAAVATQPADSAASHRSTLRGTGRSAGLPLRPATSVAAAGAAAQTPSEEAPLQLAAKSAMPADVASAPAEQEKAVIELPSCEQLEASGVQPPTAVAPHQKEVVTTAAGGSPVAREQLPASATIDATSRRGRQRPIAVSPGVPASVAVATPQTAKRPRGRPPRTTPGIQAVKPSDDAAAGPNHSATLSGDERCSAASNTSMANDHAVAGDSVAKDTAVMPDSNIAAASATSVVAAAGITNGTTGSATGTTATGSSEFATSESYTALTSFEAGDTYSTTSKWCTVM